MGQSRGIKTVLQGRPTLEGAGVHLKRAFGFNEAPEMDPFLLLDEFHSDNPAHYLKGFPWHPHRGIETITYMLQGRVEHGDSMGNQGVIEPGDVQWMTAGSGIIHQEMPKGDGQDRMWGFQLWANLPARHKMTDPRYREVKSGQIPEAALPGGARVKVICGLVAGVRGPVRDIVTQPQYLDVTLPARSRLEHQIPRGHQALAYIIEGQGRFGDDDDPQAMAVPGPGSLIIFADGDWLTVNSQERSLRFLLVSGRPLNEPVAWQGPIVMNTREELRIAFEEYQQGTFLKHPH